jgi:hypothetical protein
MDDNSLPASQEEISSMELVGLKPMLNLAIPILNTLHVLFLFGWIESL